MCSSDLAGFEMDLDRIRGRPLRNASVGWALSLVLAIVAASAAVASGLAVSVVLIALALTTTAIGTLVPILADAAELDTPFGGHMLAIGAAGEFLPLAAVTMLAADRSAAATGLVLGAFVLLAVAAAALALRPRHPRIGRLLATGLHASSQLPVRAIVLLVVGLVFIASHLGLDALLGAFAAGLVARLANRGEHAAAVEAKISAVAGGVFVPAFFVVTGIGFDLRALTSDPAAAVRVPVFLLAFLAVRGLPTIWSLRHDLGRNDRVAAGVLGATALPLVVAITTLGLETQDRKSTRLNSSH